MYTLPDPIHNLPSYPSFLNKSGSKRSRYFLLPLKMETETIQKLLLSNNLRYFPCVPIPKVQVDGDLVCKQVVPVPFKTNFDETGVQNEKINCLLCGKDITDEDHVEDLLERDILVQHFGSQTALYKVSRFCFTCHPSIALIRELFNELVRMTDKLDSVVTCVKTVLQLRSSDERDKIVPLPCNDSFVNEASVNPNYSALPAPPGSDDKSTQTADFVTLTLQTVSSGSEAAEDVVVGAAILNKIELPSETPLIPVFQTQSVKKFTPVEDVFLDLIEQGVKAENGDGDDDDEESEAIEVKPYDFLCNDASLNARKAIISRIDNLITQDPEIRCKENSEAKSTTTTGIFNCSYCKKEFLSRISLRLHVQNHERKGLKRARSFQALNATSTSKGTAEQGVPVPGHTQDALNTLPCESRIQPELEGSHGHPATKRRRTSSPYQHQLEFDNTNLVVAEKVCARVTRASLKKEENDIGYKAR